MNGLIPFELWSVAMETYFAQFAKKLWTTAFCTRKSILISEAATSGIQAKVSTILKEVVVIVWVEERLDSIWIVYSGNGNLLCGFRKKLWLKFFLTGKSTVISEASTNGF